MFAFRPRYRQAPAYRTQTRAAPVRARLRQHRPVGKKLAVFDQNDNYINAEFYFRFSLSVIS